MYFYLHIADGAILGSGLSEDGTIPANCLECTEDLYNDAQFCVINADGSFSIDAAKKTAAENAETLATVQETITQLITLASEKIATLQDAVDLGIATTEETASLTAWKTYRVAVNRVPTQSGYPTTIDWPPVPE